MTDTTTPHRPDRPSDETLDKLHAIALNLWRSGVRKGGSVLAPSDRKLLEAHRPNWRQWDPANRRQPTAERITKDFVPCSLARVGQQDWPRYFGRSFVINLDRRPDRLTAFRERLPEDWPFATVERLAAVDGTLHTIPDNWRDGQGAYGLWLTACDLLRRAIAEAWDGAVVILEDDAIFADDFSARAVATAANLPADWDIWMIGQGANASTDPQPDEPKENPARTGRAGCTHAWAIAPQAFPTVLNAWLSRPGHIDITIGTRGKDFRIFRSVPSLAHQALGASDISGMVRR